MYRSCCCVLLLLVVVTSGYLEEPKENVTTIETPEPTPPYDGGMDKLPEDDEDKEIEGVLEGDGGDGGEDDGDGEDGDGEEDGEDDGDDGDDHIKDIKCPKDKLVINGALGQDELKKIVKICVVENYLPFKNQTDPNNLKLIHNVGGVFDIFNEGKAWTLPTDSPLIYPLLIRIFIKTEVCQNTVIRHVSVDVADEHEAQIRIGNTWHHYENNQDNDKSFHVDINQPSQSDHLDIFLDKVTGYRGGIGSLDLVLCCQ